MFASWVPGGGVVFVSFAEESEKEGFLAKPRCCHIYIRFLFFVFLGESCFCFISGRF